MPVANVSRLPQSILDVVAATTDHFHLLERAAPVVVALSGGKDSTFLALILRELGYDIRACIIDVGYEAGWGSRVADLGRALGLDVDVVSLDSIVADRRTHGDVADDLGWRLRQLRQIDATSSPNVTPCTQCFNSKSIGLRLYARRVGAMQVAFGHHAKDAIASLLKLGLMYIDAKDRGGAVFAREPFSDLVDEFRDEIFRAGTTPTLSGPLASRVAALVALGFISTDEPPAQPLAADEGVRLVRPLFRVWEDDIVAFRDVTGLATEGSGCGHGATRGTESPREMVHWRILHRLTPDAGAAQLATLLSWAELGLQADGRLITNTRNGRAQMLGANYKPNAGCSEKL